MSNQELNNHKKSDAAKWWLTLVGFILTGVILVGMMFGIITPVQMEGKNPTTAEQTETSEVYEGFTTRFVNTQNVMLSSETPVTYAANGAYVEQTLTATVSPANATNKKVDWTVAWADGYGDGLRNGDADVGRQHHGKREVLSGVYGQYHHHRNHA